MILKPFQLVRVLLLAYTFVDLIAQLCGLGECISQVVMVGMFTWCVL